MISRNHSPPAHSVAVAMADVDGEKNADLVVANEVDDTVAVFLNTGDGSFAAPVTYPAIPDPRSVALADVNGDGRLDLAAGGPQLSPRVRLNMGGGAFGPETSYPIVGAVKEVFFGDVDGDGKPDMLAIGGVFDWVAVWHNIGDGTFAEPETYSTLLGAQRAHLADMNADGALDVVVVVPVSGAAGVLLNKGDGTFGPAAFYDARGFGGTADFMLGVGDLDGDGRTDIVAPDSIAGTVTAMINTCLP